MDFQKLKHLLAVVEHGTFSRAAEAVNLSQPALSRSIRPWKPSWACRCSTAARAGYA